jgi:ABC-2 type transport system permease protein
MIAYYSLFKMRLLKGLQYRVAALAGVTTQFFWGFMYIMIYEAFYKSTAAAQPISLHQLIQVLWLQQGFLVFFMLWYRDNELINLITNGNIAYELCRPIDLYSFWYAKLIAQRLSGALLRCFPILIVAALLPAPYNFTPPSNLKLIFSVAGEFFFGLVIPVPLMPEFLKKIVYLLPFRYASDLPFRIYSGNIGYREATLSIFVQIFWILLLVSIGKKWLKKSLKKVIIQGG